MTNELAIREEFGVPDRQTTQDRLSQISEFQTLVRSQLIPGHDFGTIPGTQKPTLFKPGAEKIVKLMSLADTFEIIDVMKDWTKGIFSYTVKCALLWQGDVVSEGLGECNTMEAKYRFRWAWPNEVEDDLKSSLEKKTFKGKNDRTYTQYKVVNEDPFTLVNTVLKMAKKRAMVDAALSVGRLSDMFTQDIEDMAEQTTMEARTSQVEQTNQDENQTPEYSRPEPVQPFDPDNPTFANKGEFMKVVKERLDMGQRDVLEALSAERMTDLDNDKLLSYWTSLQALALIPPKE